MPTTLLRTPPRFKDLLTPLYRVESGLYYIVVSRGKKQKEDRSSQQSSSSSLEKISFLYSSLHAKAIVSQAAAFAPPWLHCGVITAAAVATA